MSTNLLNKYVWLVETIYKAGRITFEQINEKWLNSDISDGVELPLRTFHKWRVAVEEMFGLIIDCERKGGYHYYISNIEELKNGTIRNWLLNTISVSNLLIDNIQLKDRILLENVPSGQEYLSTIVEAMKNSTSLTITYKSFWKDSSNTFEVEPYCIKLFKQRWYMVARSPYYDQVLIYSFDRILNLSVNKEVKFNMPQSFSSEEFFEDFYGVIADSQYDLERVVLKVSSGQANYLRSLPLHHSQQEVQREENFSLFELCIRPTYDFIQEILRNGEEIEVLEPLWLRNEVAEKIILMLNKYNKR